MKSLYRIYMVLATVLMTVSCMVEEAGRSNRDKYNIIHYSENVVGLACVFQPVSAVTVARDADIYLSLSEQEKEEFDVASLFPGGIRHIDQVYRSRYLGNSFGKVRFRSVQGDA